MRPHKNRTARPVPPAGPKRKSSILKVERGRFPFKPLLGLVLLAAGGYLYSRLGELQLESLLARLESEEETAVVEVQPERPEPVPQAARGSSASPRRPRSAASG